MAGGALSDYRIFETEEFQKRLDKLSHEQSRFLRKKLTEYVYPQLRNSPFFGPNIKKLRGMEPAIWRYRIGAFRIFYLADTEERVLSMLSVDPRKDAYR